MSITVRRYAVDDGRRRADSIFCIITILGIVGIVLMQAMR